MELRYMNQLGKTVKLGILLALILSMIPSGIASGQFDTTSTHSSDAYKIVLISRQFVPSPEISPSTKANITISPLERVHVLMQFQHIPDINERRALGEAGVELLAYVPNNAWFASIPSGSIEEVFATSPTRWIGEILLEDKISPYIQDEDAKIGDWAINPDGTVNLIVEFFRDVSLDDAEQIIESHDGVINGRIRSINAFVVAISQDALTELVNEDGVQWIEEVPPPPIEELDQSRPLVGGDTVQAAPYNLDGSDVQVLVYDGGNVDNTHNDLQGRVRHGEVSAIRDHATHVAGIIAGDGSINRNFRGMAPSAEIISYDNVGYNYDNPANIENEYRQSINVYGIDIASNSWGYPAARANHCEREGDYTTVSQLFDNIVKGGLGVPITVVFSGGNERGDGTCGVLYNTTNPPKPAKNIIAVGAINSDDDSMTTFSSWGPVDDGRIKPDVVAPGGQTGFAGIVSTMPDGVVTDDFINGVCPYQFGLDGIDDFFFPYTNSNGPGSQDPACEDIWEGTSMAAPHVSGSAALMLQGYRNTHDNVDPWPSTIKALLIQTAIDLDKSGNGQVTNDGPDYGNGYGRIDVQDAVDVIRSDTNYDLINHDFVKTDALEGNKITEGYIFENNHADTYKVYAPTGTTELKVTLVWTDVPGTPNGGGKKLVNDLDLVLVDPNDVEHHPWTLDPIHPEEDAKTDKRDDLNPVEQVIVDPSTVDPCGPWEIRVIGHSVPVPTQSYSLISSIPMFKDSPTDFYSKGVVKQTIVDSESYNPPVEVKPGSPLTLSLDMKEFVSIDDIDRILDVEILIDVEDLGDFLEDGIVLTDDQKIGNIPRTGGNDERGIVKVNAHPNLLWDNGVVDLELINTGVCVGPICPGYKVYNIKLRVLWVEGESEYIDGGFHYETTPKPQWSWGYDQENPPEISTSITEHAIFNNPKFSPSKFRAARMFVTAKDIKETSKIAVYANDNKVGYLSQTGANTIKTVYITIPASYLITGDNILKLVKESGSDFYMYSWSLTIDYQATAHAAIDDGLKYLRSTQQGTCNPLDGDGSWCNNVGMTSLATLAFLNAGYTEDDPTVNDAIRYILANQNPDRSFGEEIQVTPSEHNLTNRTVERSFGGGTYDTSLAVLALVAIHNSNYDDEISDAATWLKDSQWDKDCLWGSVDEGNWQYGGFGYGSHTRPDLSNTQFALMALDATPSITKDDPLWDKAQVFLARVQNRQENVYISDLDYTVEWNPTYNKYDDGGFVYHPGYSLAGNMKSYGSMTGAGIWGLRLSDVGNDDPRVEAALNWVTDNYMWDGNPGMGNPGSGQYYYYLSMSKALTMIESDYVDGHNWYLDLSGTLAALQKTEGYWINERDSWFWEDNKDLVTSYAILSLQTRAGIPEEIKKLSYLTFILCSNADLHVYDPLGRHVGKNYDTGGIDLEIPGATYNSNGIQEITISELESGDYRILLMGTGEGDYTLNVTGGVGDETVSEDSYTATISEGEVHDSTVSVAMITWLTIHVEKPEPVLITDLTNVRLITLDPTVTGINVTSLNLSVINETYKPGECITPLSAYMINSTGAGNFTLLFTDIPDANTIIVYKINATNQWIDLNATTTVDTVTFTMSVEDPPVVFCSGVLPPIADANGPYTGVIEYIAVPITFDGTGSYDPDGTIVSYDWDLDNDGEFDDAVGATPTVSFTAPYSGNISLKVTDNNGATDTDTTTLTITKHSPPLNGIPGLIKPPEQPQYFKEKSSAQGIGYVAIDKKIQDWDAAIDVEEHMKGFGEFAMESREILNEAANISDPTDPNYIHQKMINFQGNATNRLFSTERFESPAFYGGTGTRVNKFFDVSELQKDESSSIKTISAPGGRQSHSFETMDEFSGIWSTDSEWQEICQKDIRHYQLFKGNFSVQKDLTFEQEVGMP